MRERCPPPTASKPRRRLKERELALQHLKYEHADSDSRGRGGVLGRMEAAPEQLSKDLS